MGNCCGRSNRSHVYILLSLDLWPKIETIIKVKKLLKTREISRIIIGCRETETCTYWQECLNLLWEHHRVEYIVDPLLEADDYFLIMNQARPNFIQKLKHLHILMEDSNFSDRASREAFFEHFPTKEWKVSYEIF